MSNLVLHEIVLATVLATLAIFGHLTLGYPDYVIFWKILRLFRTSHVAMALFPRISFHNVINLMKIK